MESASTGGSRWSTWGLPALLAVTAVAYLPLLPAGFAWDDAALVVDNRVTEHLSDLGEIFRADLWTTTRLPAPSSGYYRPLLLLSLAVDRALFGLSPVAHHLDSLAWHLGAVAVLLVLLRRLLPPLPALAGAAFFALHPVQSETVALIAARNDSMAAVFLLLALLALERPGAPPSRCLAGGAAALAALLSKESAVLAPLFLLALDLARFGRPRGPLRYGGLVLAVGAYLALRAWAGVGTAAVPDPGNWRLVGGYLPQIAGVYGSLVAWPWPLTPARHVHYLPPFGQTALGLAVTAGLLAAAVAFGLRRALVLAGLAWAALAFGPTLAATLDKGLLGERYLYLPMAGLALVLAASLPEHRRVWQVGAPLALAAVAGLMLRLPAWKDSETLWTHAHADAPTPFTAAGLGWYLNHEGRPAEALPLIVDAIDGTPPYHDACPLLVSIPLTLKDPAEAARLGRWALEERGCPATPLLLGPYAVALAASGRWDEAMALAQRPELAGPGPGQVVLAAGMLRQGNAAMLQKLAPAWTGTTPLVTQVLKLLRLSGEAELAARLEAAVRQGAVR